MKKETKRKGIAAVALTKGPRIVYLFKAIDEDTSQELIEKLKELDEDKKKKPITLYICSPGGECTYGFAIADVIERMKCKVIGIGTGEVCSMAPVVLLACHERYLTPNSFVMFHPMSTGAVDYLSYVKDRVKWSVSLDKMYERFVLSHCKLPKRLYRKSRNGELWLSAEEALKHKIVSKIL